MTKREAAIISAYTGILCGSFSDLHAYIEQIMGRTVWTHELASEEVTNTVKEKSRPDFLAICNSLTEDTND